MMPELWSEKHRPQTFEQVVGQPGTVRMLQAQVRSGQPSANHLFVGDSATGKTTLVHLLSKALNCLEPIPSGSPCGECKHCQRPWDALNDSQGTQDKGLEMIRKLVVDRRRQFLIQQRVNVFFIDEAQNLTRRAMEYLLPWMEQETGGSVLCLATDDLGAIPETLRSRCQVHRLRPIPFSDAVQEMSRVCEAEGVRVDDPAAFDIVHSICEGNLRECINMIQGVSAALGSRLTVGDLRDLLV